jgi:hypothetical protein
MAVGFPGGAVGNTFVPSHEASNSLVIGYSRNPKKFRLPEYTKYIPVKQGVGYYLQITAEEGARVVNTNLQDFMWADGAEAPMGNDNLESFQFVKFSTKRYAFPFNLGYKASEQADWEVIAVMAGFAAMKAMTARTVFAWNILGTTANFGGNTATATALAGGQLDAATQANPFIKKTIRNVAETILQGTNAVVQRKDMMMISNPHTAGLMSESPEIMNYFVNNQYALAQVRGDNESQNGEWGMPDKVYGMKYVIEDAVKTTSRKSTTGASPTKAYVCPAQTLTFVARPGQLQGMEGIPEFSAFQFFFYEEFTVEKKDDPDNRRTTGRVVDDYDAQLVSQLSAFALTAATSS